jgi:hypothetical protein
MTPVPVLEVRMSIRKQFLLLVAAVAAGSAALAAQTAKPATPAAAKKPRVFFVESRRTRRP